MLSKNFLSKCNLCYFMLTSNRLKGIIEPDKKVAEAKKGENYGRR